MAIVYKLTSKTSNKSYIGITNTTMERRFKNHVNSSNNNSSYHIHKAIRKYGSDDFLIEILEDNIIIEQMYEKEKFYISQFDTLKNGYNMTEGGEGTHGMITVYDTTDNITKNVFKDDYYNFKERYIHINSDKVCVKKNGKNIKISKKEYSENKDKYEHINKGMVAVIDTRDNKSKKVTVEDYKKFDFYESVSKNMLPVIDKRTNTIVYVSKEEFENNDYFVHPTKDKITIIDIRDNTTKKVSVEDYKKYDYYKSLSANKIEIFDNNDDLKFICYGNFNEICKENSLSISALRKSYQNNGEPIFTNISKRSLNKIKKDGNYHLKGWYAKKV